MLSYLLVVGATVEDFGTQSTKSDQAKKRLPVRSRSPLVCQMASQSTTNEYPTPPPPHFLTICHPVSVNTEIRDPLEISRPGLLPQAMPTTRRKKVYIRCDVEGCDFVSDRAFHVSQHKQLKHDINVTWFDCEADDCLYRAKTQRLLASHRLHKHNVPLLAGATEIAWFRCEHPDCSYKSKQKGGLTRHNVEKHPIELKEGEYYPCEVEGCDHRALSMWTLKEHEQNRHNIGVAFHSCDTQGCQFRTKYKSNLKLHNQVKHDKGVVWFYCGVADCDFKGKRTAVVKVHKLKAHDIGEWLHCTEEGCDYRANSRTMLKQHQARTKHSTASANLTAEGGGGGGGGGR